MAVSVRRSSTEIGLAFEKHSLRYLNKHLHMSLRRVGRAGDGGVDLRGSWYVPYDATAPGPSRSGRSLFPGDETSGKNGPREEWRRLRVIGQCKAEKKALGPRAVRELEGVVAHVEGVNRKGKERSFSPDQHPQYVDDAGNSAGQPSRSVLEGDVYSSEIIAILLSQSGFSKNAMLHAIKSHTPLMLVHLPGGNASGAEGNEVEVEVGGVWCNSALCGNTGLLGRNMELRREILNRSGLDEVTGDAQIKVRYGLYHEGKRLERLGPALGDMEEV